MVKNIRIHYFKIEKNVKKNVKKISRKIGIQWKIFGCSFSAIDVNKKN